MRMQHLYPKTRNVGDHFVRRGVEHTIREVAARASRISSSVDIWPREANQPPLWRRALSPLKRCLAEVSGR
jgi:hypothetical protein